jgi:Alanine dehydrogenase/PNT, C-terminal domain
LGDESPAEHIKKQDIIIATALIPGRPAPRLVSAEMVKSMKPGSVLIDLAIERGGNVEDLRIHYKIDSRPRLRPTRLCTDRTARRVPATYGAADEPASCRMESRSLSAPKSTSQAKTNDGILTE